MDHRDHCHLSIWHSRRLRLFLGLKRRSYASDLGPLWHGRLIRDKTFDHSLIFRGQLIWLALLRTNGRRAKQTSTESKTSRHDPSKFADGSINAADYAQVHQPIGC